MKTLVEITFQFAFILFLLIFATGLLIERYVLAGLLIEWGIKPDEYVVEPIWNLLDKIIDFYENH